MMKGFFAHQQHSQEKERVRFHILSTSQNAKAISTTTRHMMFNSSFLLVALTTTLYISPSWAFMASQPQTTVSSRTALHYHGHRSSEDQLDITRRRLEWLIQEPEVRNSKPPALTSGTRKRLELEIELLESLADSDEAIAHLMNLWVHEYPSAAEEIEKIQYLDRLGPRKAEAMLREMVQKYPEWPEPAARLALLVGLNKNSQQALKYMDAVLSRKPWHFEVQHMQVLISLQHKNFPRALRAARVRLPPRTQPKRRQAWVAHAVQQAKEQLKNLEVPPPPQLYLVPEVEEEDQFQNDAFDAWQ